MGIESTIRFYEGLSWEEVSMTKALRMWANNHCKVKCVEGNISTFYNGQEPMTKITHRQVLNGKWYVSK